MSLNKNHPRQARLRGIAAAAALLCLAASGAVHAQIVTDSSLGSAGQALTGPAYSIPQSLGRLSGANLFHSFQTFNIGTAESATFSTSTPGIANVISRVSGGSRSQINGLLRLTAVDGTPGFFFINPAGITFGAGAAIDVPGAFHVGSADHVVFPDGRFNADLSQASSFSSAAPQAFGFLGGSRSAIELRDGAGLISANGQAISLSAGDISIDNSGLVSRAGSVRVTAVGNQAAEIGFSGTVPATAGNLTLSNGAAIVSTSLGALDGAAVSLNAGRIDISGGASVISVVVGADSGQGGALDIVARDALLLSGGGNITSTTEGAGDGGAVRVLAGNLALSSGGNITSTTDGAGDGGAIRIGAGELAVDSEAYIYSSSAPTSSAGSGAIELTVERGLSMDNGANVSTANGGARGGGAIRLQAGSMQLDRQAYVQTDAFGDAASGNIVLEIAGQLALANKGRVVSGTSSAADAGSLDLRLGALKMESQSFVGSLSSPGASGSSGLVDIKLAGDANLSGGAGVLSSSASTGDAAPVRLSAVNLRLDNSSIRSNPVEAAGGASGSIELVLSGDLTMVNSSSVDTSTLSAGNAGTIVINARDIVLDGDNIISSSALDGSGSAGAIKLTATGRVLLQRKSSLSTSTSTAGKAGEINLSANSVLLETGARINSLAGLGSSGDGGNVTITAEGELLLRDEANVGADTAGPGQAGTVRLVAGSISLDRNAYVSTSTTAASSGNAGRIEVITLGDLRLSNSALINSDTQGQGHAGLVDIRAGNLSMDSGARISSGAGLGSRGDAGLVDLNITGDLQLSNSAGAIGQSPQISTSTLSSGKGGEIRIRAAKLLIDAVGGGVVSSADTGSSGNAGNISIQTSGDVLIRKGVLSSSTAGTGAAGRIDVEASRVMISGPNSGLIARAGPASAGQVGNILVQASDLIALSDQAFIAIDNDATVVDPSSRQPTSLRMVAPEITLSDYAVVSADSAGNVAASDIVITAARRLSLQRGVVSTSANDGNGGSIKVSTGGLAELREGLIRTSVFGAQGNGGDIDLGAGILLLDSGFVQANTAAPDAAGGRVQILAGTLVTSGNSLFLGGNTAYVPQAGVFGFNVIQAAAPTGVSGNVQLDKPVLDVTGSLRELRGQAVDAGGLGRSLCQNTGGSALALAGRGGMPASAGGLQRAQAAGAPPDRPAPVSAWPNSNAADRMAKVSSSSGRGCL